MNSIRCGRGLGDSLYLQSVVRHLVESGLRLRVKSDYPDVFLPLGARVEVVPFSRVAIDLLAHYSMRKGVAGTTQFQDCCITAGIKGPVDLRLDWIQQDHSLVHELRRTGRRVVLVQLPRAPMGRVDGFGKELLPDCRVIQRAIDRLRDRALIVQVGSGVPLFKFTGIDIDLANQTSVSQLIDVASIADGFLGYCSFIVPLAESFSKPALLVWSRNGLKSGQIYVRRITPEKVLHRASSKFVVDDWPGAQLDGAFDAFLQ